MRKRRALTPEEWGTNDGRVAARKQWDCTIDELVKLAAQQRGPSASVEWRARYRAAFLSAITGAPIVDAEKVKEKLASCTGLLDEVGYIIARKPHLRHDLYHLKRRIVEFSKTIAEEDFE